MTAELTGTPVHLEERAMRVRWSERGLLALAAVFVWTNVLAYHLVTAGSSILPLAALAWMLAMAAAHLILNRQQPIRDPLFLPIVAILTGWGLILVTRLAPGFAIRQTVWVVMATAAMLSLAIWPRSRPGDPVGLRWLRRYRYTWLFLGLGLLGLTLIFGVNPSGAGLRFWLGGSLPLLGRAYFQPSELLKLLAVAFLASYMAEKGELVKFQTVRIGPVAIARPPFVYLAPLFAMWGLSLVILAWQRDLGAATLFFIVFLIMLYLASGRWEAIASGLLLLVGTVALAYYLPVSELDIVRLRIDTWLNPWPEAADRAFQIVQSLMALASGGLLGQGVGQGYPTYVPVVHSDFAFAAVAEEWGLVGSLSLLVCISLLVYRGLRLAILTRRPFLAFLATGLSALIGVQSLIILGGVTKLLPLTGVTLPFVSYGGSSLLVSAVMVGLLIKISGEVYDE